MRVNMEFQQSIGLNTISIDQVEEIHLATLEVMKKVGINFFHQEALELFYQNGARVDGNRVYIPEWMVQEALASVPCRVAMGNRNGGRAMFLEKNRVYYGTGSAAQYVMDVYSGERRPAAKQDVANAARIADALENVDFIMSMSLASDAPKMAAFIHEFEAMVLNSTKPIIYCANNGQDVMDIISIAEVIAGGLEALQANPFIALYAEPSSPLQHTKENCEKLLLCAEKRLPVICEPAVLMGGTGPVTAAGTIVVANCEILSGLVLHQLKCKGAPFIYGGSGSALDMRTMVCAYGGPEEPLNCAAMVKMANYYKLPIFTTAGCTDAHVFDQQAGLEATFNLLINGLAGANLIHDLGYIGSGAATSMEMLLLCNESVGMIRHILKGLEITSETLALDVIEKVGPGGNYFAEEHTFNHFKKTLYTPEILNRYGYDKWKEQGAKTYGERANQKVRDILENHRVPDLPNNVVEKVKEIVARRNK